MDAFTTIFHHIPQHNIVVCKEHQQGLPRIQLATHLKEHKEYTITTRQAIVQAADQVSPWAYRAEDIQLPSIGEDYSLPQPLPFLPIYHDGYQCVVCNTVASPLSAIQKHVKDTHQWVNPAKKGRPSRRGTQEARGDTILWETGVWCQKYQKSGRLGTRFAVSSSPVARSTLSTPTQQVQQVVAQSMASILVDIRQEEERRGVTIQADNSRFEPNPWLQRTGWAKHLQGFDRQWLLSLLQDKDPTSVSLVYLGHVVKTVIWKAQQECRKNTAGYPAMKYVNRRETGTDSNETPLNVMQSGSTMEKYCVSWLHIIQYIWKTYRLEVYHYQPGQEAVAERRPPYQLTRKQEGLLTKIASLLETQLEEEQDSSPFRTGYGEDSQDSDLGSEDELELGTLATPSARQTKEELEELVLDFLLALLDHPLGDNEFRSPVLSGMSVLGIDPQHGWVKPDTYTPKQSAIITISRMLVVYKACIRHKKAVAALFEQGCSQVEAKETAPSHFSMVQEMVGRFMTLVARDGNPTPLDAILSLRAYGLAIQSKTNTEGKGGWLGDRLLYGPISTSLLDIQAMVASLVHDTRHLLLGKLMFLSLDGEGETLPGSEKLPTIPWTQLADDPSNVQEGWSFMEDLRNKGICGVPDPKQWLATRLGREPAMQKVFLQGQALQGSTLHPGTTTEQLYSPSALTAYLRLVQTFRAKLLPLIHMAGGLPPRGTEMVTIQYKNTINGEARGVFVENGLVACVTRYHKGIRTGCSTKVIHRYLPVEVGELLVYYLWFVLPFAAAMEWALFKKMRVMSTAFSAYIWEPRPEKRWTQPKTRIWRKRSLSTSTRDTYSVSGESSSEEEADVETLGQDLWDSQKVSSALKNVTAQHLGVGLSTAPWRHMAKMLYRREALSRSSVQVYETAERDQEEEDNQPYDIQQGHSSKTAEGIYGRDASESAFSTEAKRRALRKVSLEWHKILNFPSTANTALSGYHHPVEAQRHSINELFQRYKQMQRVNLLEELQKLLGPESTFRGIQEEALSLIQRGTSPLVVVMGTGSGKSLLFMLPAAFSTGVTVVIVPLVSLRQHMLQKCSQLGIPCIEWDSKQPTRQARIVLVTPESANRSGFRGFLNHQRTSGLLDRIVIDEAHVILDSVNGWRRQMLQLFTLFSAEVPMVYLTATLPPMEQTLFADLYKLPPTSTTWLRTSTVRPNIAYQVYYYARGEEEEELCQLVHSLQAQYEGQGQIIIYCATVDLTKKAGDWLGCPCYYREVSTAAAKTTLAQRLLGGLEPVWAATSAWGLGLDNPHIRAVIHLGKVRNLKAYSQESGRAGRDGKPCEAILMQGCQRKTSSASQQILEPVSYSADIEPEVRALISGDSCMRVVLDQYLDGDSQRTECTLAEEKCSRCRVQVATLEEEGPWQTSPLAGLRTLQVRHGTSEEQGLSSRQEEDTVEGGEALEQLQFELQLKTRQDMAAQVQDRVREEVSLLHQTIATLERNKGQCYYCISEGSPQGSSHTLSACTSADAQQICQGSLDLQQFIQEKHWEPFSCCFHCGIPQGFCSSWQEKEIGGFERKPTWDCQLQDVLIPQLVTLWYQTDLNEGVEDTRFEAVLLRIAGLPSSSTYEDCKLWLTRRRIFAGYECSNAIWFLAKLSQQQG